MPIPGLVLHAEAMPDPARSARWTVTAATAVAALALGGCGSEPFEPRGEEASAARAQAWGAVEGVVERAPGAAPIGEARFDHCSEGQKNWKIQDEHAHECTVSMSVLVPAARTEDGVGPELVGMGERIKGLGCSATWRTLAEVETGYWQQFRSRETYGPGSLPGVGHDCADGLSLTAEPVGFEQRDPLRLRPDAGMTRYPPRNRFTHEPFPVDTSTRARKTGNAMFWLLTATEVYYATDF